MDVPHNFEYLLRPDRLGEFGALKSVEWNCCFFNDIYGERTGRPGSGSVPMDGDGQWARELVWMVERSCPTLGRLEISKMSSRVMALLRLDGDAYGDLRTTRLGEEDCAIAKRVERGRGERMYISGPSGSRWLFEVYSPALMALRSSASGP